MASQVDICNMALGRIGARQRIGSMNEQSEEARILKLVYPQILGLTLEQVDWGFARRRKALTLLETDPNDFWAFRYELPADCACPRNIQGFTRNPTIEELIPWEVEGEDDPAKRTIFSDMEEAVLQYTRNDVPTGSYPSHFVHALAWNLAVEIAMPLTGTTDVVSYAINAANAAVIQCGSMSANQRQPDDARESEFVRARDGGVDTTIRANHS